MPPSKVMLAGSGTVESRGVVDEELMVPHRYADSVPPGLLATNSEETDVLLLLALSKKPSYEIV
jgi:hypothetical protein